MPLVIKLKPGPYKMEAYLRGDEEHLRRVIGQRRPWPFFVDELGGLENIIESVEWVDE